MAGGKRQVLMLAGKRKKGRAAMEWRGRRKARAQWHMFFETYDHGGVEKEVAGEDECAEHGDAEGEDLAARADEAEGEVCDGGCDEDAECGKEEPAEEVEVALGDHDVCGDGDEDDGGEAEGFKDDDAGAARKVGGDDDGDEDGVGECEEDEEDEVCRVPGAEAEERDEARDGDAECDVDEPLVGGEVVADGADVCADGGEADGEEELERQDGVHLADEGCAHGALCGAHIGAVRLGVVALGREARHACGDARRATTRLCKRTGATGCCLTQTSSKTRLDAVTISNEITELVFVENI
jgi:hypothetical protein